MFQIRISDLLTIIVSGRVRTQTYKVPCSLSVTPQWARTTAYVGSNEDNFCPTKPRTCMVSCLIVIHRQKDEQGTGKIATCVTLDGCPIFPLLYPCLVYYYRSGWLKLGVVMVKRASCPSF